MLKTYMKSTVFTLDGELVEDCYENVVIEDDTAFPIKKEWHGLEDIECAVTMDLKGILPYKYSLFRNQFGLIGCGWVFLRVRKKSILQMFIKYEEVDLSLNELFRIKDSKKVIEYMKQQEIAIPMKA